MKVDNVSFGSVVPVVVGGLKNKYKFQGALKKAVPQKEDYELRDLSHQYSCDFYGSVLKDAVKSSKKVYFVITKPDKNLPLNSLMDYEKNTDHDIINIEPDDESFNKGIDELKQIINLDAKA